MSDFSKKLFSGVIPTSEDWENHLKEVHQASPAMSPVAFATHMTELGVNSYQILADTLTETASKPYTVLDLACGDGHFAPYGLKKLGANGKLIGVDMTQSEVDLAKSGLSFVPF